MAREPLDLRKARILVANDDGIHAPGIKLLTRIAQKLSKDVWVVAPESEQSAASHSLTVRRPVRIRKLAARRFAVDGTPTDCVLLGVLQILKDHPPDLVLSGVNGGSNLAEDIAHSGTVAAASMGATLGIRSVALSQVTALGEPVRWGTAEAMGAAVVRKLMSTAWPQDTLLNVNFPDRSDGSVARKVIVTRQGRRRAKETITESVDPFGRPYYWIGAPRQDKTATRVSDIAAVNAGAISVTPLRLDLTEDSMMKDLRRLFE